MSSPLCSLDKSKKSPANPSKNFGKRSMPMRPPEYIKEQELLDELEEQLHSNKSYMKSGLPTMSLMKSDDSTGLVTPRKLLQPINSRLSPMFNPLGSSGQSQATKTTSSTDMELLSTMMKRITQLEKQVSYYSKEVIEKDRRIKVLEEKLTLLNKAQKLRSTHEPTRVEELENKCYQLQQQVHEMETFLADYGMIWVGDSNSESDLDEKTSNHSFILPAVDTHRTSETSSKRTMSTRFKVDFDLILKNIKDLNIIAGEGQSKVEKTKDGARLKVQQSVPLILYSNGIMMFNGPFRPYDDITTQRCLGDIMDGYFPTELHKKYPEGVPLQITDKRHVVFKDPRLSKGFPGVGRMLEEEPSTSSYVPNANMMDKQVNTESAENNEIKNDQTSELPGPRLSVDQFLQKLPKSVVHEGKVIGIRSSLKEHITTGQSSDDTSRKNTTEIVETAVVQEMQERMNMPVETRPVSARDVTTIRVKSESGLTTFIIKMRFTDTIADLRQYINKQRPKYKAAYEIMSTFPNQKHTQLDKTLQESGLVPNATLHLKPKK